MADDQALDRLEEGLRAAVAADRPALGASATLRAAVLAIPDQSGWRLSRPQWAIGLAVTAAAIVALATWLARLQLPSLPQAGQAPAPTFDPTVEGQGIRFGTSIDTLHLVPAVTILVLVVVGFPVARRWWRQPGARDLVVTAAIALAAAGLVGLAVQPGFVWVDGSFGPLAGLALPTEPPPGSSAGVPIFYITAEPSGMVAFDVTITNSSDLPIRLEGLIEDPDVKEQVAPYWSALALGTNPQEIGQPLDQLRPFEPVTVEPHRQQQIYLIGKAGPCAFGSGFTVGNADIAYVNRGRDLQFAYSIVGLEASSTFELPAEIVEPQRDTCP